MSKRSPDFLLPVACWLSASVEHLAYNSDTWNILFILWQIVPETGLIFPTPYSISMLVVYEPWTICRKTTESLFSIPVEGPSREGVVGDYYSMVAVLTLIILFLKMSKFSKNYFFQGKENRRRVSQLSFRESQALVNIGRGPYQGCGQRCYNYY